MRPQPGMQARRARWCTAAIRPMLVERSFERPMTSPFVWAQFRTRLMRRLGIRPADTGEMRAAPSHDASPGRAL